MIICPDKNNPAYRALAAAVGDDAAHLATQRNGGKIPDPVEAKIALAPANPTPEPPALPADPNDPKNGLPAPVVNNDPNAATVQIAGQEFKIPSKESFRPEDWQRGVKQVQELFTKLKLPGAPDTTPDLQRTGSTDRNVVFRIDPSQSFEANGYDAEGRKLISILRTAIQNQFGQGGDIPFVAALTNAIKKNFVQGRFEGVMSPEVRDQLVALAAGDSSLKGQMLRAETGLGEEDLTAVARNANFYLTREYANSYDPTGKVRGLIDRVVTAWKGFFTDEEIRNSLAEHPDLEQLVNAISVAKADEQGGRLYKRIQRELKPKVPKTPEEKEVAAIIEEAARRTIEEFKKAGGVVPEPLKDQKLTARETLMRVVSPSTVGKIRTALEKAYFEAERNAAIDALRARIPNEVDPARQQQMTDELERLAQDTQAVPSEDMVKAGFQMPKYAHWSRIKDLLGYSPTSMRLVDDLIKSDFKGGKYGKPGEPPLPDTRIDLKRLAVSPDAEVRRVFDNYMEGVRGTMAAGDPDTIERVSSAVRDRLAQQIEQIRSQVRDKAFAPKAAKAATPQMQAEVDRYNALTKLFNAGVLKDPRAASDLVANVAAKAAVKKFLPALPELIKQVINTPRSKQGDLADEFANRLADAFPLSDAEKAQARNVFLKAFEPKFELARKRALDAQEKSLASLGMPPRQARPLFQKITQFINAGGLEHRAFFAQMALDKGWDLPSQADLDKMREMSEREEALRTPPASELAAAATPEAKEEIVRHLEDATLEERQNLMHQMQVMWSKWSHPINWRKHYSDPLIRQNNVAALNELTTGNTLLKVGFPFRLGLDIAAQAVIHMPTRSIAEAFTRWDARRMAGDPTADNSLFAEMSQTLREGLEGALSGVRPALQGFARTMKGKGERRNVEGLVSGVMAFDRIRAKADALDAQGNHGLAFVNRLISLLEYGRRYAGAADFFQGPPAAWQEINHLVGRELRARNLSYAEVNRQRELIVGDISRQMVAAMSEAKDQLEAKGLPTDPGAVRQAAWNVVRGDVFARIARAGMPADEFRQRVDNLRAMVAWSLPQKGGPGGVVRAAFKGGQQVVGAAGIPTPFFNFANAMANSINRSLSFTPAGFFPSVFKGDPFFAEHWQGQRKVEATLGSAAGIMVIGAIIAGLLKYNLAMPKDPKERERFIAGGHRVGDFEVHYPDGTYSAFSTQTGPFRFMAPYFAAAGSVKAAYDEKAREQAKLDAIAAKTGVPAGKVAPLGSTDVLGALAHGAWAAISGGRTASGLIGSYVNPWDLSIKQPVAATLGSMTPFLPGYQELTRMAGVSIDPHKGSVFDLMVPLPGSGAQRLNVMGDPLRNENDLQRVVSILTGGTYPIPVPDAGSQQTAYANYYASDYRPTATSTNRGYEIGGQVRPLTPREMETYLQARGAAFKTALSQMNMEGMTPQERTAAVKAAYEEANASALHSIGVAVPAPRRAAGAVTAPAARSARKPAYGLPSGFSLSAIPAGRAPRLPTRFRTGARLRGIPNARVPIRHRFTGRSVAPKRHKHSLRRIA